jgi:hypothetical protein
MHFKRLLPDAILTVIIFTEITGCATTAELKKLNDPHRYRLFVPSS